MTNAARFVKILSYEVKFASRHVPPPTKVNRSIASGGFVGGFDGWDDGAVEMLGDSLG